MSEKLMETREVARLSDMNLYRAAVEYRQAHNLLQSARSSLTETLRSELEEALQMIERELRSRGISCPNEA